MSFNIAVSGSIGASADPTLGSQASADVEYSENSFFGRFGNVPLGSIFVDSGGNVSKTGMFGGFNGTAAGTTMPISTFAGDPGFTFGLMLNTAAVTFRGFTAGPGSANSFADFGNTVGFPTSGAVANLPDGYTLNSLDGLIVDNRFTGGGAAVPEPGSLALLGSGLAVLGSVVSRRKRRK